MNFSSTVECLVFSEEDCHSISAWYLTDISQILDEVFKDILLYSHHLIFDWHFFTLVPSSADKCNRDECSRTCQATLLVNDGWLQHSQHWSSVWYGTSTRNPSQTCRAATWRECLTTWFGTYFIMRIQFDRLVQLLYCTWKQAATGWMHWWHQWLGKTQFFCLVRKWSEEIIYPTLNPNY